MLGLTLLVCILSIVEGQASFQQKAVRRRIAVEYATSKTCDSSPLLLHVSAVLISAVSILRGV